MLNIGLGYLLAFLYAMLCIGLGELAKKCGLDQAYSRKIVHIGVGAEWFILRYFMGNSWHFFAVCLIFLILLYIIWKKRWFSGMSSDGENAPGTVYYGASMSIMAAVTFFCEDFSMPFGIAVICTSLGDGFAGIFGRCMKKNGPFLYGKKTLFGTAFCLAFSFFGTFLFAEYYGLDLKLSAIYLIALFSASVELISKRGTDNLTVPLAVFAFVFAWLKAPEALLQYLLPILLTPWVIVLANRKPALTKSGLWAAFLLDVIMTVTLGNFGFLLLLAFLGIGSLCDKVKKTAKGGATDENEKSGARDAWQVLANGGVLSLFSVLYYVTGQAVFLYGGVASIAEALGDTAASSFGAFAKKTFDPFHGKPAKKGMSGGMSLVGTAAALVFCGISLGISLLFFHFSMPIFFALLGFSFAGTILDSLLGACVQVKYRCAVCKTQTEKKRHCAMPTSYDSGVDFVNNDVVNAVSASVTALLCLLLMIR